MPPVIARAGNVAFGSRAREVGVRRGRADAGELDDSVSRDPPQPSMAAPCQDEAIAMGAKRARHARGLRDAEKAEPASMTDRKSAPTAAQTRRSISPRRDSHRAPRRSCGASRSAGERAASRTGPVRTETHRERRGRPTMARSPTPSIPIVAKPRASRATVAVEPGPPLSGGAARRARARSAAARPRLRPTENTPSRGGGGETPGMVPRLGRPRQCVRQRRSRQEKCLLDRAGDADTGKAGFWRNVRDSPG